MDSIITDRMCITIDASPVTVAGEPLHECIWQGSQWAVTEYGIECRDGRYAIPADRLSELRGAVPDWPLHMAEKDWVEIHDFCTAFLVALAVHPEHNEFNSTQIIEGTRRAIKAHNRYFGKE